MKINKEVGSYMVENKLRNELKAFLEREYSKWQYDEKNGCYFDEAYVDYDDKLSDKDIAQILGEKEPESELEYLLYDCYSEAEGEARDELIKKFQKTEEGTKYDWDEINDELVDMWYLKIPFEHYRKQEVCMDIFVDTGDMNYDYTLNAVYPHYSGRKDDEIDDKASLVWLAKTQGYTKEQLQNQLTNGEDKLDVKGFLESVYQEVINCSTSCPTLVFPIKMTLEQAVKLCKIINKRDKNGYKYEPEERKDCGSIIIDKAVDCVLYDYWAGGGGCWGIELEKDVELPIKFIYKAIPDGVLPYSMRGCYGVTSECWKKALKEIK